MNKNELIKVDYIKSKIFTVRGMQVMLDSDLAELYGVSTKVFNQAVKRNANRFPSRYMFTVNDSEFESLRSQIVTSNKRGGRRYLPNVFTEQGVAMLSAVLKSDLAVHISIRIIDAFVEMRNLIATGIKISDKIESIEKRQIKYQSEVDKKFDILFKALKSKQIQPTQGVFFNGQVFEAHKLISEFVHSHDRFLIVDDHDLYHLGASLKDLGKKWFGFSKMELQETLKVLAELR
ncbi:MAG: ORF6N domain-containing protein [bacterium]